MDKRFKNIESELNFEFSPEYMAEAFEMLDNFDLDQAFTEAAAADKANYTEQHWNSFVAGESDIIQDVSFTEAAKNTSTPYQKAFWLEAEHALKDAGLHYEYKPEYWADAERLLTRADRKSFFYRWGAVASVLLILGLIGQATFNNPADDELTITSNVNDFTEISAEKVNSRSGQIFSPKPVITAAPIVTEIQLTPEVNTPIELAELPVTDQSVEFTAPQEDQIVEETPVIEEIVTEQPVTPAPPVVDEPENVIEIIESRVPSVRESDMVKINPQPTVVISHNTPEKEGLLALDPYEHIIVPRILKNTYNLAVHGQIGIGDATNSNAVAGNRNSLGVQFNVIPKRLNKWSFGASAGLIYEDLNELNVTINSSVHDRTQSTIHARSLLTFDALVKFNSTFRIGYRFNRNNKLNLGFGFEQYTTSKVKLKEYSEGVLLDNPYLKDWGLTGVFQPYDFNFRLGYERTLTPRLALTIETRISMNDRINSDNTLLLQSLKAENFEQISLGDINNNRDITTFFGLKYNIFGY